MTTSYESSSLCWQSLLSRRPSDRGHIGRFAPTPSGALHLGSFYIATVCALRAHQRCGHWLIRIDDLDRERCLSLASTRICQDLEVVFQDICPPSDMVYQQARQSRYQAALKYLGEQGLVYRCQCSRKQIRSWTESVRHQCREQIWSVAQTTTDACLRLKSPEIPTLNQHDHAWAQLENDIVLLRRDQYYSYHLACAVDDGLDGITEIIRGADLIPAQAPQCNLLSTLGFKAPPRYCHLQLLTDQYGRKLGKQTKAPPALSANSTALDLLNTVFTQLSWPMDFEAYQDLKELWAFGLHHFELERQQVSPIPHPKSHYSC